jgi:ankyrin repeat protein
MKINCLMIALVGVMNLGIICGMNQNKKMYKSLTGITLESLKLLIQKGANINKSSGIMANTFLHRAAKQGDLEMVLWLLDNGAYINAEDKHGSTPLLDAACYK